MSHISTQTCNIKTVNEAVLQQAIEMVVQQFPGMTVDKHILDFDHSKVPVDCALHTPKAHRGVGLNWKQTLLNRLEFTGDDWNAGEEFEAIRTALVQAYQAVAVNRAMTMLGYQVSGARAGANLVVAGVRA